MTTPRAPKSRKRPVREETGPVQPATPERCSCDEALRLRHALVCIAAYTDGSDKPTSSRLIHRIASEALK